VSVKQKSLTVPRAVLYIAIGIAIVNIFILFLGAWKIGVTWDEDAMANFLKGYLNNGWFTDSEFVINGIPDRNYVFFLYAYGPIANLIAHGFGAILGVEQIGVISLSPEAFAGRHIGTAFMAMIGVLAIAASSRSIFGSWRWGVLSGTFLLVTPLWIGHGMFNIKDIPVASAFSLAVLGSVLMVRSTYLSSRLIRFFAVSSIALGALLGAGTRPAIGFPIALTVLATPILLAIWSKWGWNNSNQDPRVWTAALRRLIDAFIGLFVAYVLLVVIYPKAFINPLLLGYEAIVISGSFPFDESVLTAGTWMQQPPDWQYLPLWFAAQLPLLILIASGVGTVVLVASIVSRRFAKSHQLSGFVPAFIPIALQAFALPLVAVLTGAAIYNGTRQFLFVLPAFALLSTLGVRYLISVSIKKPTIVIGIWVLVALGMVLPTLAQVQLFPYSYAYFNAITLTTSGVDGKWPTDYWRASSNELIRNLPVNGLEGCAYEQGWWLRSAQCQDQPMFRPFASERGTAAGSREPNENSYWVLRENQGQLRLPAGCDLVESGTKSLMWQEITIWQLMECEISVPYSEFTHGS